ncbi:MAG: hypothetical protein KDJ77_09220 [Rhodobiaceae bacterium]|nr:hypothetical protein [Rhodobiaceae bacterium]
MSEETGIRLTEEQKRRRRSRSWGIAGVLAAMVVLFYVITLIKFGGGG